MELKNKKIIIIMITICLFIIGICVYFICNDIKLDNNSKKGNSNELENKVNDDNMSIKKDNTIENKVNDDNMSIKKDNTIENNKEEITLDLKPFIASKYNIFEQQMLNALSKSDIFLNQYYNNWNLEDIDYINLKNITFYGFINDKYLYKLDFIYKCKSQTNTCVFLNSMINTETTEIEESLFVYIKDKKIVDIENESGGSGPIIYDYNSKVIDEKNLIQNYLKKDNIYKNYRINQIIKIEKTEYLYSLTSNNYKYIYKVIGSNNNKPLDLVVVIEYQSDDDIKIIYLDILNKTDVF